MPLHTERLTLRGPDPAAAETINSAIRDSFAQLTQWLPWADRVPSVDETREQLTRARDAFGAGEDLGLFVWDNRSDEFVGAIGLHARLADTSRREIGYWVRTSAAGRGYASEAVQAVARAALKHMSLSAVEIHVNVRNLPSQKVAVRAGFLLTGEEAGRADPGGRPSRVLVYEMRAS